MDLHLLLVCLVFAISALLSMACFIFCSKKEYFTENLLTTSFAICFPFLAITSVIAFVTWYPYDIVSKITLDQFIISLLGIFVSLIILLIKKANYLPIGILISSLICTFGSDLYLSIIPNCPVYFNKLATTFLLYVFAVGFRSLCGVNSYPQIQGGAINLGIVFLYFLGQAPFILGICSSCLLGSFLIAYYYCREYPLGTKSAPLIGFILGWIGLMSYQEFLGPCFVIFSMLYLVELVVSIAKKATFMEKYKILAYNSVMLQALNSGIPAAEAVNRIFGTNILLIVMGVFQLASPSSHSLIAFTLIIVIWQINRTINWKQDTKSFKEINKEIATTFKENFKKVFSKKSSNSKNGKKK